MSTFHPKAIVKETINVDYETRITPQKVAMVNRENVFYGSFAGEASLSGSTLVGATLSGATLYDPTIMTKDGAGVNLTDLATLINDAAERIDEVSAGFREADIELSSNIIKTIGNPGEYNERITALELSAGNYATRGELTHLHDEMENADNTIHNRIVNNEDQIEIIHNRINDLEGRIENPDYEIKELRNRIAAEEERARGAESEIESLVVDEHNARVNAVDALTNRITNETTAREEADHGIRKELTAFVGELDEEIGNLRTEHETDCGNLSTLVEDERKDREVDVKELESSLTSWVETFGENLWAEGEARRGEDDRLDELVEGLSETLTELNSELTSSVDFLDRKIMGERNARVEAVKSLHSELTGYVDGLEEEIGNVWNKHQEDIDKVNAAIETTEEDLTRNLGIERSDRIEDMDRLEDALTAVIEDLYGEIDYINEDLEDEKELRDRQFDALTADISQETLERELQDTLIRRDLIGSLKYMGHITLTADTEGKSSISLSESFKNYLIANGHAADVDEFGLKNGWIYQATVVDESGNPYDSLDIYDTDKTTKENIHLFNRDYIIIHKKDLTEYPLTSDITITWNEITRDTIDIVDAMDNNIVVQEDLEKELDKKEDKANKTGVIDATSSEDQYPTAKAVYDELGKKEDGSNKTQTITSASTVDQYPSAKAAYDEIKKRPTKSDIENGWLVDWEYVVTNGPKAGETVEFTSDFISPNTWKFILASDPSKFASKTANEDATDLTFTIVLESGSGSSTVHATRRNTRITKTSELVNDGADGLHPYATCVEGAVKDNFAALDDDGNIVDSGVNFSTFSDVDDYLSGQIDILADHALGSSNLTSFRVKSTGTRNTHSFYLRTYAHQEDQNVIIDWGDGSEPTYLREVSLVDYYKSFKNVTDSDLTSNTIYNTVNEYNVFLSHTYATDGEYTVKIHGDKYWGLMDGTSTGGSKTVYGLKEVGGEIVVGTSTDWISVTYPAISNQNLISEIFSADLLLNPCVMDLAAWCRNAINLTKIQTPDYFDLTHVINWSGAFEGCTNLVSVKGFKNKWFTNVLYAVSSIFSGCTSLKESTVQLPSFVTNGNYSKCYYNCTSLETGIENLLPTSGFITTAPQFTNCFTNCNKITRTTNGLNAINKKFFGNPLFDYKEITATSCFSGTNYVADVPSNWGGTKVDDTISKTEVKNRINSYLSGSEDYTMDDILTLIRGLAK